MAKQAWDRGETAMVRQLLEPYRTDPDKQQLRNFAWYYLWQAAYAGGNNTLRDHQGAVRSAAFTPDSSGAVTLGDDGAIILWDTTSGKKLKSSSFVERMGNSYRDALEAIAPQQAGGLAINADGSWVAAYGNKVYLGSFTQSQAARHFDEHTAPIRALALSRDGRMLATGDDQGELIVRDLPIGRIIRRWKSGAARSLHPRAIAFSRDGKLLLIGMQDGSLFVLDAATGGLQTSESFGQGITSIAIARDGQTVAVALGDREGVVQLWDPATGKTRAELRGHQDVVTHVAYSPDGKSLLTASADQTVRLWSAEGHLLKTLKGHLGEVDTAEFSPDGEKIVTGGLIERPFSGT